MGRQQGRNVPFPAAMRSPSVALRFSLESPSVVFALRSCCVAFLSVLRCARVKLLPATLRSSYVIVVFPLACVAAALSSSSLRFPCVVFPLAWVACSSHCHWVAFLLSCRPAALCSPSVAFPLRPFRLPIDPGPSGGVCSPLCRRCV
jgi:hypothetical protein